MVERKKGLKVMIDIMMIVVAIIAAKLISNQFLGDGTESFVFLLVVIYALETAISIVIDGKKEIKK